VERKRREEREEGRGTQSVNESIEHASAQRHVSVRMDADVQLVECGAVKKSILHVEGCQGVGR